MASADEELGQRLALARQNVGLTQDQLAAAAGLERSVVAKIETGRRRVTAVELSRLADAVGQRLEWFLSDAPPAVISRRNAAEPGEPSPEVDRAAERLAREVDFIQSLGRLQLPPSPQLRVPTSMEQAEKAATEARGLLGYELDEPAIDLATRCATVGLLAFSLDLDEEGADGASLLLSPGGIAVVNGSRQVGRRRFTLAHEVGHFFFADEFSVDWRVADQSAGVREARIDRFARALLLPAKTLRSTWSELLAVDPDVRAAAVRTASSFRVDMATLARRLTELKVITRREADTIRVARTKKSDIIDFNLLVHEEIEAPSIPRVYEEAVLDLYRSEEISSDRALELLLGTWKDFDLPALPTLPEESTWQFI